MLRKFLATLFGISMAAGFFVLLGTAGSSDLNLIDFKTALIQSGIGLALFGVGYVGLRFTSPTCFG